VTVRRGAAGRSTLYLHVWTWPTDGRIVLPGVQQQPTGARMLVRGEAIRTEPSAEGLVVKLPEKAPDAPIAVAVLDFPGAVTTSQSMTSVGEDGNLLLSPLDADLTGRDDDKPVVRGVGDQATLFVRTGWKAQYSFITPAEKVWVVSAEVSPGAYNRLTVAAPGPFGRSVTAAVQAWGSGVGNSFRTVELGFIRLAAGLNTLELKSEMEDLRPLQIRAIHLRPQ
jgi:alpha-L-fucosidase